jgi:Mg-chelatase subunit ChlI
MKLALILCVIEPRIGGVLLRGHRGTAKTTAVRGLLTLIPHRRVVESCRFGCDPEEPRFFCDECLLREVFETQLVPASLVELPLGTTEDRLLGALDLEAALTQGKRRFQPGLLAKANGSILYVDEVNLLPDHLVDMLLDVAASGVLVLEREGLSIRHPSRFVLVGTMNPEEGELRPQLLDRFGISVKPEGSGVVEERVEIARRRIAFERSPEAFIAGWAEAEAALASRIERARASIVEVDVDDRIWAQASRFSIAFEVEGHRADVTMINTARALAAFEGMPAVTLAHLGKAAELALGHRLKRCGIRQSTLDLDKLRRLVDDAEEGPEGEERSGFDGKKKTAQR